MLAGMPGWALQKVKHLNDASVDTAQVWKSTGEPYFCRSQPDPDSGALGSFGFTTPDKLAASYKGEQRFQGQDVSKFLVKHKEVEHMAVEYLARNIGQTETELLFAPVMIKLTIGLGQPDARVIAYVFDKFEPVLSISPDVFRWYEESGQAAQQFNLSACGTTLPYTSTNVIPNAATIYGTSPFTPYGSSPLATNFYWDLQNEPTLTAAAWAANRRVEEDSSLPAAPPAPPKPPSTSSGRRLRTHGSPEMAVASSAALQHAGTGRSSSALPPAVISTARDEHIRRKLANKYCTDSPPPPPPEDGTDSPPPPPPEAGLRWLPCTTTVSAPWGCTGLIECSAQWIISPLLTADFSGSITWDYGFNESVNSSSFLGKFLIAAEGCLKAGIKVGVPNCKWCPGLLTASVDVCLSGEAIQCAEADGGRLIELIFGAGLDITALGGLLKAALDLQMFRHPGADRTWCPEDRGNYVNGANEPVTVHGSVQSCLIWCFDIYNGHIVPGGSIGNDDQLKDRRKNGYSNLCWDKCGRSAGRCDYCELGAGSCCKSRTNAPWVPECRNINPHEEPGQNRYRCGETNLGCLERCGTRDPTDNSSYLPGIRNESCVTALENHDVCSAGPPTYRLRESKRSWRDARAACQREGLQLASVQSASENDLLLAVADKSWWDNSGMWISGTDAASEGNWTWSPSGTALSYTNWDVDQPNEFEQVDQDCILVHPKRHPRPGTWNDRECDAEYWYVCEDRA